MYTSHKILCPFFKYLSNYGENSYKDKFSRCVVNGRICPICHNCSSCTKVDSNGNPLRDKKSGLMSLDLIMETGYEPSVEDTLTYDDLYTSLLEEIAKVKAIYPEIIRKKIDGYNKAEIASTLPLKKSQAYQVINEALSLAEKILKE